MAKRTKPAFAADAAFVEEQTKILAADLAFYARAPVRIQLVGGNHIAFTFGTDDKDHTIQIVMNPSILAGIRLRERAIAVWRGIGFHELAHHLWPADPQYRTAYEEGFKSLFNLVDDEQNERRGRAKDASWGACFQTVCAYIFPAKNRKGKRLSTGIIDDGEEKEPEGIEAMDEYSTRWNQFAFHFRRHLPGATDPQVVEALSLIPKDFKDLSKEALLELTRRIHVVLCKDINVPPPPGPMPDKSEKKPTEEPEGPEGGLLPVGRLGPPWWHGLFRSKWSYIILAVCVLAWGSFFSQGGNDLWLTVFFALLGITLSAGLILVIRALLLKLRRNKDTVKIASARVPIMKRVFRAIKRGAGGFFSRTFGWVPWFTVKVKLGRLLDFLKWVWRGIVIGARFVARHWRRLRAFVTKWWLKLWRSTLFRIAVLAAPIALILVMLFALVSKTAEINWWLVAALILLLLLLGIFGWIFRKKIKDFLTANVLIDEDLMHSCHMELPLDKETLAFRVINSIKQVETDPQFIEKVLPEIYPLAEQLRPHMERCGTVFVEKEFQEEGYDLVDEIEQVCMGETNLMVDDEKQVKASMHIEIALDCSTSMIHPTETLRAGEKFHLGKCFALAVEQSIRNIPGISSRFWGFTDTAIYDCGTAGQSRVSGLVCAGGNNDSAMLWHMIQSAAASGKELKILLMISDGQPSDCSWGSLHYLVGQASSAQMIPVQIAVDKINDPAFKEFFVDLVGQTMAEAIITMGTMLVSLVDGGA